MLMSINTYFFETENCNEGLTKTLKTLKCIHVINYISKEKNCIVIQ